MHQPRERRKHPPSRHARLLDEVVYFVRFPCSLLGSRRGNLWIRPSRVDEINYGVHSLDEAVVQPREVHMKKGVTILLRLDVTLNELNPPFLESLARTAGGRPVGSGARRQMFQL